MKEHNYLLARIADGEEATISFDEKADGLREAWFRIGRAFVSAKKAYPSTQAFGAWIRGSPLSRWGDDERACAMKVVENEKFARIVLEGTSVTNPRWMWERMTKAAAALSAQLSTPSSQDCEVEPDPGIAPESAPAAEIPRPIPADPPQNGDGICHGIITPRVPGRPGKIEQQIGEDAHYIRGWYTGVGETGSLAGAVNSISGEKKLLAAVAAAIKSGECIHAPIAYAREFDIRMAFPHIPEVVAKHVGRSRNTWAKLSARVKGQDKTIWERFTELNELCKARSDYTVEKPAPHGTYRLRTQKQEDELGQQAWQWWQTGHWPGEKPKLQLHAGDKPGVPVAPTKERLPLPKTGHFPPPAARPSEPEIVYFGMSMWPLKSTWRDPNDPTVPTKTDLDNTYWFVEELHRVLTAAGISHRTAARHIRNWSKYVAELQRPAAAANVMQDMAQGIDMHGTDPTQNLDLKMRVPSRPIKFAK